MSSYKIVGIKPHYTSNKVEFEWEIPKYFSANFIHKSLDSPPFYLLNAEWCLRIISYANNFCWHGLYLVVLNPSASYSLTFTLGIRNQKIPCQVGPQTETFDKIRTSHGKQYFFVREDLKMYNIGTSDSMVVYCDATGLLEVSCQTTSFNSTTDVCNDLQDLLLTGRKADLTISVRGQEFKAHKLILEARSPVFAAMFEYDMAEKKENIIKIEDFDPETFQKFLQCVYAGSVENLSADEAIRLYMISHKYAVTGIVKKCAIYLAEELNEDIVCDILALANRYNEADLKKAAGEFMAQNATKILSTTSWSTLTAESSLLQKYSYVSRNDVDRAVLRGAQGCPQTHAAVQEGLAPRNASHLNYIDG